MLTAKQHELIRFIQQRLEDTGISPSFEEMKEALDLKSKSGVHRLISALEERGFIRRLPNRARALEVVKLPENAVMGSPAPVAANDAVSAAIPAKAVAPGPASTRAMLPICTTVARMEIINKSSIDHRPIRCTKRYRIMHWRGLRAKRQCTTSISETRMAILTKGTMTLAINTTLAMPHSPDCHSFTTPEIMVSGSP